MLMVRQITKLPYQSMDSVPVVDFALPRLVVKPTSNRPAMIKMIQFIVVKLISDTWQYLGLPLLKRQLLTVEYRVGVVLDPLTQVNVPAASRQCNIQGQMTVPEDEIVVVMPA